VAEDSNELTAQSVDEQIPSQGSGGACIYCNRCGYANPPTRGACLMCLNMLLDTSGGQACASCEADNPKTARFCRSCGATLEVGAVAVLTDPDMAARVLEAVGDMGIGADSDVAAEGDYADDAADYVDDVVDQEDEFAAPPPPPEGAKPVADEVSLEDIPGDIIEPEAPQPQALALDEDLDFAVPAPPGAIEPEPAEDDFAPPPPPPGVVEPAEDDFAPPPPPPGDVEPAEDDFAPPPPPPGATADQDEPAPPAKDEGEQEEEGEFGDWELDFTEADDE